MSPIKIIGIIMVNCRNMSLICDDENAPSNEKESRGDEKRKEKYTRDVAGRSDRDTLADRWTEEQPLLPTKPPGL